MYSFILSMWVAGRLTETQVRNYVTKGFITSAESDLILATPQVV